MTGRLITVEGLDGTGKSTLVGGLAAALRTGEPARAVEVLREPGGVALSERVRALVKDPALTVGARAEALLYAAARAQLAEEAIAPALAQGRWLLLDRFVDSSLAYQGGGRELGIAAVRALNAFGLGAITPDRTLLLQADDATRAARLGARGEAPDRLEREDDAFFARIAAAYEELARAEPERVRVIDASGDPAAVLERALVALAGLD